MSLQLIATQLKDAREFMKRAQYRNPAPIYDVIDLLLDREIARIDKDLENLNANGENFAKEDIPV